MEQEEITKIYETLAPMAGDYANAQAEQIGMAQKSMGPLAANTMGTTTSGLGNYTYNRLMRPQVDTMRDEIMVQGYANQLNRLLSDKLNEARNRYNRSGNGGGDDDDDPDNKGTTGVTKINSSGSVTVKGSPTEWGYVPNAYSWTDKDGNWHTASRKNLAENGINTTDVEWAENYYSAKEKAAAEGREFKDGE